MGQGREESKFLGPIYQWDTTPVFDFSYSTLFFVLLKHSYLWYPVLALSAYFPLELKLFPLTLFGVCVCVLNQTHLFFFSFLTCNNLTGEFLILALVAVLMGVNVQFHSFVPDEEQ